MAKERFAVHFQSSALAKGHKGLASGFGEGRKNIYGKSRQNGRRSNGAEVPASDVVDLKPDPTPRKPE